MMKRRLFRMTWILPTLLAGVGILVLLDNTPLLTGNRAANSLIATAFAATMVFLVAAWFIEGVFRLITAFRRGVREREVAGTVVTGLTTVAERTTNASVPLFNAAGRISVAFGGVVESVGNELARQELDPTHPLYKHWQYQWLPDDGDNS